MFNGADAYTNNGMSRSDNVPLSRECSKRVVSNNADCNSTRVIGQWNVSQVTDMRGAMGCQVTDEWYAAAFNQNIGQWNGMCRRSQICSMFYGAAAFNQEIGQWNVSQVTTMSRMFECRCLQPGYRAMGCVPGHIYEWYVLWCRCLQPGYRTMECVPGHRYAWYVLWCRCLQPGYRAMECVPGHRYGMICSMMPLPLTRISDNGMCLRSQL